jgi:hypothetical protein
MGDPFTVIFGGLLAFFAVAAQNEMRRCRGAAAISEEEVREQVRRWRGS